MPSAAETGRRGQRLSPLRVPAPLKLVSRGGGARRAPRGPVPGPRMGPPPTDSGSPRSSGCHPCDRGGPNTPARRETPPPPAPTSSCCPRGSTHSVTQLVSPRQGGHCSRPLPDSRGTSHRPRAPRSPILAAPDTRQTRHASGSTTWVTGQQRCREDRSHGPGGDQQAEGAGNVTGDTAIFLISLPGRQAPSKRCRPTELSSLCPSQRAPATGRSGTGHGSPRATQRGSHTDHVSLVSCDRAVKSSHGNCQSHGPLIPQDKKHRGRMTIHRASRGSERAKAGACTAQEDRGPKRAGSCPGPAMAGPLACLVAKSLFQKIQT